MNKKTLMLSASLLLVLVLGFWIWKTLVPRKPAVQMEEIIPELGTIKTSISTTGTVEPQNRLELKPPISGRVEKIMVKEGESVRTGQILALLSSTERAALLDAARMKDPEELQYWENAYKATPIIAPINGKVIVRNIEPGQTVSAADALFVLSDRLMINATVDETDVGNIAVGQKAVIELDAYPDVRVTGQVEHISYESTVVNNVTIYHVEIIPDQVPKVFRSGMSANIEVIQKQKENVLKIPATAVIQREGRSLVMVKSEGERPFRPRKVELGISDLTHVEIIQGLSTDDIVVIVSNNQQWKGKDKSKNKNNPFMPNIRKGRGGGRRQ